jgi:hypothetical protein
MPCDDCEVTATYRLLADLSGDGFVGQADLDCILDAWGQSVPPAPGPCDFNDDDFIGQSDLDVILDSWGQSWP